MKIIQAKDAPALKNIESLPRGTGAKYMETMTAHNGDLVALCWRRKLPISAKPDRIFIQYI